MKLGQIVVTKRVNYAIYKSAAFSAFIVLSLQKYKNQDWGDLCEEDKKMNDSAVKNNDDRILAKYNYGDTAVYIITEWDHSATTVLFVDEY